ncbi:MAG: hypothetical protein QGI10_12075 [Vicinamibacterales bacterium]|nr:hypothetical protein [Vicinamibacterales bacterium]
MGPASSSEWRTFVIRIDCRISAGGFRYSWIESTPSEESTMRAIPTLFGLLIAGLLGGSVPAAAQD